MDVTVHVQPARLVGSRDPRIYGQFIEHFHRQIYGGLFEPGSPLADAQGFRTDVLEAVRKIKPPVIRWPGGCFASAYHWKDGVGAKRTPSFDKAWRVEEPNMFGTDEFVELCRRVGAEPYICTNAGTGTPEEMSDWVEYCNLPSGGVWASKRIENGHRDPFGVKYWSIGNENYLPGEMGSKTIAEWGPYVRECAKVMKRVDPTIEILAACIGSDKTYTTAAPPFDWNAQLLKEAGGHIDWVSIHGYWDRLNRVSDSISPYESCMVFSTQIEERILYMRHLLGALGLLGRIRIAFDEWNLRCWHHPSMASPYENAYLTPRDINDVNSQYTTADAIFTACFLNQCLKHCDVIGMANFSPLVNTRGAIFTHGAGIVARSTYHVFQLYTELMGDEVVDWWVENPPVLDLAHEGKPVRIDALDAAATRRSFDGAVAISLINRDPTREIEATIDLHGQVSVSPARYWWVAAAGKDAWNGVEQPESVRVESRKVVAARGGNMRLRLPAHSVGVLVLESAR